MNREPGLDIKVQRIVWVRMKQFNGCQQQWRAYHQGDHRPGLMSGKIHSFGFAMVSSK
jgi:hypothetical protein